MVHHILEHGWGIAQAEVHDHWFIEAVLSFEHRFVLVSIFDAYFVKSSFYVELGKAKCVLYFCNSFLYEWKGVSVADSPSVYASVVLYGLALSI